MKNYIIKLIQKKDITDTKIILNYYKNHFIILSNNTMNSKETLFYLENHYLAHGVCYCTTRLLNVRFNYNLIKIYLSDKDYFWFTTPAQCSTKAGMLICLKYRIDKMEELIKIKPSFYIRWFNKIFKKNDK